MNDTYKPNMQSAAHDYIHRREASGWWYRVRRELVSALLSRYAPVTRNVLEVGCGGGQLLAELTASGMRCTGIDIEPQAVEYARSRGLEDIRIGTATELPFANESFDVVIALDVLEHLATPRLATGEMYRVLKVGGTAILFVPALNALWSEQDVMTGHYRRYDTASLLADVDARFSVIRQSYFNSIFFLPILIGKRLIHNLYDDSVTYINNPLVDFVAYHIFRLEIPLLKFISFPFGVSRFIVIRK